MNKTIKEIFNEIDLWLKTQDSEKFVFLQTQPRNYRDDSEIEKLNQTLYYHKTIRESENLDYIFGDKIATLDDIKNHMLTYIESQDLGPKDGETEDEFNEDQHSAGYAGMDEVREIIRFWKKLDPDALMAIAAGRVEDDYEIDLDGYRCYLLSRSKVHPLIFNFIFYTLKKEIEDLGDNLYNDNNIFDQISEFYPPQEVFLPSSEKIKELYNNKKLKNKEEVIKRFNSFLNNILKNDDFQKEEILKEKLLAIEKLKIN